MPSRRAQVCRTPRCLCPARQGDRTHPECRARSGGEGRCAHGCRSDPADRERAKTSIAFLGQAMGRALHLKLREIYEQWASSDDDTALLSAVCVLADQFAKDRQPSTSLNRLERNDLDLICYEYLSA